MIKGMTGYGATQVTNGKIKAIVELKSVNHRYLDLAYYLPNGFGSIESKIQQIIQKHVVRGRLTIAVRIVQKPSLKVSVNKEILKKHLDQLNALKKEFKLKDDLTLLQLVQLPGVLETKETMVEPDDLWAGLESGIKKSLAALIVMRKREGKSLVADLKAKLTRMKSQINQIQLRKKKILTDKRNGLNADEYKAFEKSCDVNEELARLTHYIDEMKLLLQKDASVGKEIDFMAQEMQREANTIGSKVQDKIVSNAVITIKGDIEKIREQAQNVE